MKVAFECYNGRARIVRDDDGCGFDPEMLPSGDGNHLGLDFKRDRMVQFGGSLAVHSQPGAGTQLIFRVPMKEVP